MKEMWFIIQVIKQLTLVYLVLEISASESEKTANSPKPEILNKVFLHLTIVQKGIWQSGHLQPSK